MRTSARAAFAGVAVFTALLASAPLTGCGGGSKNNTPSLNMTRAKGAVTMTVVWPERSRLIPAASDTIIVTLTRTPDANLPTAFQTQLTFNRPAEWPTSVKQTTGEIPTGTYTATAVAKKVAGNGTIDPTTGDNVVQAAKTAGNITVGPGSATPVALTMDSTIANITLALPTDVEVGADTLARVRPGQSLTLTATAFDATATTATPAGPYRVPLTPSKLQWTSSDNSIATVSGTGVVTASAALANTTTPKNVTITLTDTESQKTGTVSLTVVPVGLSQVAQWAKFHGDLGNTGNPPGNITTYPNVNGTFLWKKETGSAFVLSSAAIAQDGTIYIGTRQKNGASEGDHKLYALDPKTGGFKWVFDAGAKGYVDSAPVIGQDGTIYFGTLDGDIFALKDTGPATATTTGYQLVWQRKVGGPVLASPTIDRNGVLYVATVEPDNKLYAFNSLTGSDIKAPITGQPNRIWQYAARNGVLGTPALSEDQRFIYIASRTTTDSTVYIIATGIPANNSLSYANGATLSQSIAVDGPVVAAPLIATVNGKSTLFVATTSGSLLAYDGITGGAILTSNLQPFRYDASAPIFSTPALSADTTTIYLATLDNTSGISDHKIVAVNTTTGAQIWRTKSPDINGNPYFSDGFTSSPALSGDGSQLYIGCRDGTVYAVDTSDNGNEHSAIPLLTTPNVGGIANSLESSPALGSDGKLVIGGFDGTVYAIQ